MRVKTAKHKLDTSIYIYVCFQWNEIHKTPQIMNLEMLMMIEERERDPAKNEQI